MELEFIPMNPTKNYTILVTTRLEPALRPAVAAQLLLWQDPPAEQVAFLVEEEDGRQRLEMMGGEFCGNTTRGFAMLQALQRGMEKGVVEVEVSGHPTPVKVEVDLPAAMAWLDMPLPREYGSLEILGVHFPIIVFEGICHAIVHGEQDQNLRLALCHAMAEAYAPKAMGVIFLQNREEPLSIHPSVFVPATGTTVWERSCGTGSVAAALWLARHQPREGLHTYKVEQPGGLLEVTVEQRDGEILSARLGGSVILSQPCRILAEP